MQLFRRPEQLEHTLLSKLKKLHMISSQHLREKQKQKKNVAFIRRRQKICDIWRASRLHDRHLAFKSLFSEGTFVLIDMDAIIGRGAQVRTEKC